MNLTSAVKTAKSVITANSPVLLLGTTIAGVVTTGVLAAKAGWNARGIVDAETVRRETERTTGIHFENYEDYRDQMDNLPELSLQEKAQLTWKQFTFPAISAAGSIASAVGTHVVHTKRANAMAMLYAATTNKLDDYTAKAEELLGPKKTQQLQNEVAQSDVDREPFETNEVMMTDEGTELCRDEWSKRWFMSSMQKLESAVNELNRLLIDDGNASLNQFYDLVGLDLIPMGESFGWSGPDKVNARFGAVTSPDGRPAITISFHKAPKESMGIHP